MGTSADNPEPPNGYGITAIERITRLLQGHPTYAVLLAVFLALPSIVAIVGGISLIVGGDSGYGFAILLAAILLAFVEVGALLVIIRWFLGPSPRAQETPRASKQPEWSRLVPKVMLNDKLMASLRKDLEGIRRAAVSFVQTKLKKPVIPNQIRANIFLPDIDQIKRQGNCELHIPSSLCVGMDEDTPRAQRERNIRFWPNQGLTGVTFVDEMPSAASSVVSPSGPTIWERRYRLTDEQKDAIHENLRWIVSFPLRDGKGQGGTMGVLNVDGLHEELGHKDLTRLTGQLGPLVAAVAGRLKKASRVRISVRLEEA